jgi:hypothetical protein
MKPTSISLTALFNEGSLDLSRDYRAAEDNKRGNLRAGAGGALLDTGDIVGGCHRKAFARWLGKPEAPPDPIKQSNFDAGFRNEDNWMEKLKRSWTAGPILCEDDIPTKWLTSQGVPVTGRPDMVLCEAGNVEGEVIPRLMVEHKAVVSVNKAAARWLGEVDPAHFIQACHYSMAIGCPATLVYSSSIIAQVPWFVKKVDRDKFWPKGKGWQLQPFKKEFKIGCTDAGYYYYLVDGCQVDTKVNAEAIKNYYELMVDMRDQKSLYKRHSNKTHEGKLIEKYNVCDYCNLKDACDQYETDYQRWVDEVMKGG